MLTVETAFALALDHHKAGRLAEAQALYRQILGMRPDHADTLHFVGVLAYQIGRHDLAVDFIRRAILVNPNNPAAFSNLGVVLAEQGRSTDAILAYHRALELNPAFPDALSNLGNTLKQQGKLDEAVAAFHRAIKFNPAYAQAYANLGGALQEQGDTDAAIHAFRQSIKFAPEQPQLYSNLILTLHSSLGPASDAIADEQRRWNQRFCEPIKGCIRSHANNHNSERRLTIGYISRDFCDHAVGYNLFPLFRHHNHRQFEVICYSAVSHPDIVTAAFHQRADRWRGILGVTDEALTKVIREDGVDILVDLAQHSPHNRLPVFARQPAPVQVSFAGYPASTGVEAIEYRISDSHLESEPRGRDWQIGWKHDSETARERVFLIDSFWCYDPFGMEVAVNELPAMDSGQITFGCLNNFCKVNEPLLKLWARVLAQVPNFRLLMLTGYGSHRQRTLDFLENEGVAPERVEFVERHPRKGYLELYHLLDIVLDTFPYNGHTTSLDALWMGVPVVSLAGERPVSRGGLSQLSNLGLPELVSFTEDDYVRIAVELANDLTRLQELRRTLRRRMESSMLMNAPRFARNLESAYRAMWRRWCVQQS